MNTNTATHSVRKHITQLWASLQYTPRICAQWLANASPIRFPQTLWYRRELPFIIKSPVINLLRRCTRSSRIGPPSGPVSALTAIRNNQLDGRIVTECQGNPIVTPESLMVKGGFWVSCADGVCRPRYAPVVPIFWGHYSNARLLAYSLGLIDNNKQLVEESVMNEYCYKDPAYRYLMYGTPTRLAGPWTSIISEWVPNRNRLRPTNYAHWLLEALPRLGVLDAFPANTKIIVPSHLRQYQKVTLELLGLQDRYRPTPEQYLSIEDYYFSTPVTGYSQYSVKFLRDRLLKFADKTIESHKRFFLKRAGSLRKITNEAEVLEFFNSIGWAAVDTANMPFTQQVQLFAEANAICGIHGAGIANTLWCRPGCILVELCADKLLNGCFELVAQAVGVQHHHLIFESDYLMSIHVDINRLRSLLQSLALA